MIFLKVAKIKKGGCFKHITKRDGKAVKEIINELDENQKQKPIKSFSKKMSNYFSVGIDARIGLGSIIIK